MAGFLEDYTPITNKGFNLANLMDLSQSPFSAIPLNLLGPSTGTDTNVTPELPTPDTYNLPTGKSGDGHEGLIGGDSNPSIYEKGYWGGAWSPDAMFSKTGLSGIMQDLGYAKSSLGWNMKNTAMGPMMQSVLSGMAAGPLGIVGMLGSILGAGAKSNNFLDPTVNKAMQEMFNNLTPDIQATYGGWQGFSDMMTGIYGTGPSANPKTDTPISIDATNKAVQAGFARMGVTDLAGVLAKNPKAVQALVLDMRVNNTATNVGMALDAMARSGTISGPTMDTLNGLRAKGYYSPTTFAGKTGTKTDYRTVLGATPPKDLKATYDFAARMGISPFASAYAVAILGAEGVEDAGPAVAASAVSSALSATAREISAKALDSFDPKNPNGYAGIETQLGLANNLTNLSKTVNASNYNSVSFAKALETARTVEALGGADAAGSLGAGPGIDSYGGWQEAHTANDPENVGGGGEGSGGSSGGSSGGGGYGAGERGPDTPR